ncbi:bacteriophage spanin2 family protein [Epilithonimonas sp.]|uniref:bacteriophage spanin2 family protein n=1 Tax=Epilithonimonas sp. TaxID=2894511 RepID=UPI0035B3DA16
MKYPKIIFKLFTLSLFALMISCQTRVVGPNKPMNDNTLELYKKYTIQTNDAKTQKLEIIKVDADKIYGKDKSGAVVEIPRNEVREIKKPDVLSSVIIGAAAIAAVIFVPI